MTPHIRVTNLIWEFKGVRIINQASFDVRKGETFVLLGHRDSGKTTLFKMLNRLLEPSSGQIEINGVHIARMDPEVLRRSIASLGSKPGLFPHMTIEKNASIVPRILGWSRATINNRTEELCEVLKLHWAKILGKYPQDLSPLQQSKVGVLRALAGNPELILLDEPFSWLNPVDSALLKQEFFEIPEVQSKTKVLATSNKLESVERGDHISVLDRGVIRSIGSAIDLLFAPRNQFVAQFFQEDRFQLELAALRLGDILEVLPIHTGIHNTESTETISFRASLLDILRQAESSSDGWGQALGRARGSSQGFS